MGLRLPASVVAVSALVVGLTLGGVTAANAATFELVDAVPTDTISTVNGPVTVTSAFSEYELDPLAPGFIVPAGEFRLAYAATGYFATTGRPADEASVTWTFSQPVYELTVYFANIESTGFGGGGGSGDPQRFRTNLGAVNLASVAGGGNLVATTGELLATQLAATPTVDRAECNLQAVPFSCSGTFELRFPSGITSFTSFNGLLPQSGFNNTGIALATDVVDPAPAAVPGAAASSGLAATGANVEYGVPIALGILAILGLGVFMTVRDRRKSRAA